MTYSSQQIRANPAADAAALLHRIGIGVLTLLVPTLLMGARHPVFVLFPVGMALIIIAALVEPQSHAAAQIRGGLMSPVMAAFLLFFLWSWVSLLWAPDKADAALRYGKVMGILLLGLIAIACMPTRTRLANLYLAPIGLGLAAIVGIVLALLWRLRGETGRFADDASLVRGTLGAVVLLWPALGALAQRGRWGLAVLLAGTVAALALVAGVTLAAFALIMGILVFAMGMNRPMAAARTVAGVTAVLMLTAPVLPSLALWLMPHMASFPQVQAPLAAVAAWSGIFAQEGAGLIIGHGVDSAAQSAMAGLLPVAATQGILFQIWFDLGVLGALFGAVLIGLGLLGAARVGGRLAPFMVAGIASALTIAVAHFTLSQIWWVNVVGIAGVAMAHNLRGRYIEERPPVSGALGSAVEG